jgi:hypothetical protein
MGSPVVGVLSEFAGTNHWLVGGAGAGTSVSEKNANSDCKGGPTGGTVIPITIDDYVFDE